MKGKNVKNKNGGKVAPPASPDKGMRVPPSEGTIGCSASDRGRQRNPRAILGFQLMLPEGPAILFKKRERNIPSDADSHMP